jgi:hypothetical protein
MGVFLMHTDNETKCNWSHVIQSLDRMWYGMIWYDISGTEKEEATGKMRKLHAIPS